MPAITPTLHPADPSKPSFTVGDVRAYVQAKQFHTLDGSTPQIVRIDFMPASKASTLLQGESIGRPPTALVCVVEVRGKLSRGVRHGPPIINGPVQPLPPAQAGWLVFDAHTGNFLLRGVTP
jgi:hypothetical protein